MPRRKLLPLFLLAALVLCSAPAVAANRIYDKGWSAMVSWSGAGLAAPIDFATDTIKVAAVTAAYTPNTTTDQFYSTIAANVVGTPQVLTYASATGGVYKSSNNPVIAVPATTVVTYIVMYKDTGTAGTSPLIAVYDTGTNIPFTAGGSTTNMTVTMNPTLGWLKP